MAEYYSTMGHTSPYLQAYNHYQVEHFQETKDTGAREIDSLNSLRIKTKESQPPTQVHSGLETLE
jgi:hypothetical protein